ncbi:MAG TPA: aromatic ring-opening dioxygenase subunit LigA [Sphingomicrobium sp.]|nr:aromatic ring-opening dioxygenase subunit LigA [Sphingomicrobium sp.]
MSLYSLQKLLYDLNRDARVQDEFLSEREDLLARYRLNEEEAAAVRACDVGMLYILGVNGQILMHFAAWRGLVWDEYIQAMKDALAEHGQVRGGIYGAVDGGEGGAV